MSVFTFIIRKPGIKVRPHKLYPIPAPPAPLVARRLIRPKFHRKRWIIAKQIFPTTTLLTVKRLRTLMGTGT